jgi:hypothetical protein
MAEIIDERRMQRIISDAASYRYIRQIILSNDRTDYEPTTAQPEIKATKQSGAA